MERLLCTWGVWLVAMSLLPGVPPRADVQDLSNGVFITHYPLGIMWTVPAPTEGWCQHYVDNFAIECCEQQNASIPPDTLLAPVVWFVLSAWDEPKEWCGFEFGFADYDEAIFTFLDWGKCCPCELCLEYYSAGWPGPLEGTAVTTTGGAFWSGNLVPVYWFSGYAYAEGVIPLGPDPTPYTPFAGWGNCVHPPELFEATCLGGLGVFIEGLECCPEAGPSPHRKTTWGTIKHLYR